MTVTERTSAAVSADMKVKAIGRNILPSTPSQAEDRQEHDDHDQAGEHDRRAHLLGRLP